ncbi:hypothetical protein AGMMS49957_10200 [Synergistales bacterium]|nr:hypothetical protein AGMMS49957_10200 [Synergistales bacterium]
MVKELQGLSLDVEVQYDNGTIGGMVLEDEEEDMPTRGHIPEGAFFDENRGDDAYTSDVVDLAEPDSLRDSLIDETDFAVVPDLGELPADLPDEIPLIDDVAGEGIDVL